MELNDLKNIWQNNAEEHTTAAPKAPNEIGEIIRRKATGILSKIRRNFFWDVVISAPISISIVACVLLFMLPGISTYITVTVLVCYSIFLFSQLRSQMPAKNDLTQNLKDSLETTIMQVKKMKRLYLRYMMVIFPLVFLSKFIGQKLLEENQMIFTQKDWWFLLMTLSMPVLIYYPMRWLIHRFYGRHINRLENCLKEYEEQQEEF